MAATQHDSSAGVSTIQEAVDDAGAWVGARADLPLYQLLNLALQQATGRQSAALWTTQVGGQETQGGATGALESAVGSVAGSG